MRAKPPLLAYLCLATSVCLVGTYVGLSKPLVAALPVFLLAWLRFGIAAVAMVGWLRDGTAPTKTKLSRHDKQLLFIESFVGNFLFSICMLYGVAMTSALAAGITLAAIPVAVSLLSWAFLGERISARIWMAMALSASGIALLSWARVDAAAVGAASPVAPVGHPLLGQALLIAAVFCEATYVVVGKRLTANLSPKRISAFINLWGLLLMTPFGLWQALTFDFTQVQSGTWALLVFYALAASMVSVWLWMRGLQDVPAAQAGVFMVLMPLSAAAVGVGLLGESFTAWHALAFALGLTGLLIANKPVREGAG